MKLNFGKLAQMASGFFGIDNSKLNNAISQAEGMTGDINSRSDALNRLRQYGIGDEFLTRIQNNLMRNPMASRFASMLGVDINDVNGKLNQLKSGGSSTDGQPTAGNSTDARIRKMKERLKGVK